MAGICGFPMDIIRKYHTKIVLAKMLTMGDFAGRLRKKMQLPLFIQCWAKSLKLISDISSRWRSYWSKENNFPHFSHFRRGGDIKIDFARN